MGIVAIAVISGLIGFLIGRSYGRFEVAYGLWNAQKAGKLLVLGLGGELKAEVVKASKVADLLKPSVPPVDPKKGLLN